MGDAEPFTFAVQYPVRETAQRVAEAFRRHGFARSLPRDSKCLLQWAPFGSLRWDRFHAGTLAVSSFFAHSSLVNKALLAECLRAAGEGGLVPETRAIRGTRDEALEAARRMACAIGTPVVLKAARGHNALDLHFVTAAPEPATGSAPARGGPCAPSAPDAGAARSTSGSDASDHGASPDWVAQAHVDPLLIAPSPTARPAHKFHLRANVLLLRGVCYVHRDIVCHVATAPFAPAGWEDAGAHITNHSAQRRLPAYRRERHTPTLVEAESALGADAASHLREAVHDAVGRTMRAATRGARSGFWLAANAWEVFGFDFLPKVLVGAASGGVGWGEESIRWRHHPWHARSLRRAAPGSWGGRPPGSQSGPRPGGRVPARTPPPPRPRVPRLLPPTPPRLPLPRPQDVCARLTSDVAAVVAAPLAEWIERARAEVEAGGTRSEQLLAAAGATCDPPPAARTRWTRVWASEEPAPLFDSRLLGYTAHRILLEEEGEQEEEGCERGTEAACWESDP